MKNSSFFRTCCNCKRINFAVATLLVSFMITDMSYLLILLAYIGLGIPSATGVQKTCFRVEGMVCGKCVQKVEHSFKSNSDIKKTSVSLKNETVSFESTRDLPIDKVKAQFQSLELKAELIQCE